MSNELENFDIQAYMPEMDADIQEMLDERRRTMELFTTDYKPLNMYALFPKALNMSAGKLAAQAGHAFDQCHDLAKCLRPEITSQYKGSGNGTKICMYAKNISQLIRAYRDCQAINIPCMLIIDRGDKKFFGGKPIITALGIGPVYKEEVQHITKRYTMID